MHTFIARSNQITLISPVPYNGSKEKIKHFNIEDNPWQYHEPHTNEWGQFDIEELRLESIHKKDNP